MWNRDVCENRERTEKDNKEPTKEILVLPPGDEKRSQPRLRWSEMFFICSGDQAGVIKPTALGSHFIKTLLYRCTTCKNFKRIPALRLRLVPRPLGRLQGGQLACFYDQEVQNAHYTPEQLRLLLQLLASQSSHTWVHLTHVRLFISTTVQKQTAGKVARFRKGLR